MIGTTRYRAKYGIVQRGMIWGVTMTWLLMLGGCASKRVVSDADRVHVFFSEASVPTKTSQWVVAESAGNIITGWFIPDDYLYVQAMEQLRMTAAAHGAKSVVVNGVKIGAYSVLLYGTCYYSEERDRLRPMPDLEP